MVYRFFLSILVGCLWPAMASAHSLGARLGDFYEGFLHPPLTIDHVFPLLALGLLAGQQGKASGRMLLLVVPLSMLAGGCVALVTPVLIWIKWINLSSFIVLGLLVAFNSKTPLLLTSGLALLFGLSHGYTNGQEVTAQTDLFLFFAGVSSAALILVAYASAVTVKLLHSTQQWQPIAIRVAGSWIAAMGILMLAAT